ncbi:hypothetical protein PRZ48_010569 [Zasmidium cellare]|uniref:Glutathione S-transferase n=1 Tax=Zasmidium cellare TaxID=395010 RepID=A0ABR0E924_ZASCE|nr:hypothetical protein PRZ48_010569 [Zasmidium cellare]
MTTQSPKPRLWVFEMGLYPRRVTVYLEEKGIADKFDIIPVAITMNGMENPKGKPPGTVPILEIARPTADKPGRYIFQSSAILEYFEDVYGSQGPDMRGSTPGARARVRECMDVVNEVTAWLILYVQNGSVFYGIMKAQSREAALEGLKRMQKALGILEGLADENGPFLVGKSPTLVDCVLVATVQFAWSVYGIHMTETHQRLKIVVDAFEERGTAVFPELPREMKELDMSMSVK